MTGPGMGEPSQTKAKWNAGTLPLDAGLPTPDLQLPARNEAVKRSELDSQFMRIIKVNAWNARNAQSLRRISRRWLPFMDMELPFSWARF